jgi:hypothetical protein
MDSERPNGGAGRQSIGNVQPVARSGVKWVACRRAFTVSLFVAALLSSGACGVRQDEFDCANAVSHLQQCCDGFDPRTIACVYESHGCTTTVPALDTAQSDCIRSKSCNELQRSGACQRAIGYLANYGGDVCNGFPTHVEPPGSDAKPEPTSIGTSSGAPPVSDDAGEDANAPGDAASAEGGDVASAEAGGDGNPDGSEGANGDADDAGRGTRDGGEGGE